jgi:hypothetical protein
MQSPYYGSEHIAKMYTPAFLRITTGTVLAKPATSAAAITALYGTPATSTYTLDDADITSGEYFTFATPQNVYAFYHTVSPSPLVGVDVYIAMTPSADEKAAYISAMQTAVEKIEDITFTYVAGTSFTLTAKQGGACDAGAAGTTAITVSGTGAGTGDWALIGKLGEDINLTPEQVAIMDSEGGENQVAVDYSLEFNLINVNSRSVEIVNTEFNRKIVDIAFFDVTNEETPLYIIHGIPCNVTHNPFGESGTINFKLKKRFRDPSTKIKFYDWAFDN